MFLDTANIKDINECMKTGVFKGVTTNPTILLLEKKNRMEQIQTILQTETKILFVQLIGRTVDELMDDYHALENVSTDKIIGYKISMDFVGLEAVAKIKAENKEALILGTAIYSADQGILAALAGCDWVAPYVNRMLNNHIDPYDAIAKMRLFYDDRDLDCKILAASFKNTTQILSALESGSHSVTVPPELFHQMIGKELAENAIRVFNQHGKDLEKY